MLSRLLLSVLLCLSCVALGHAAETQFGGQSAMSVAAGKPVPTNCSVYWISPEDKLYCFSNVAARDMFIANAPRNEKLADAFWRDPAFWEKLKSQQ